MSLRYPIRLNGSTFLESAERRKGLPALQKRLAWGATGLLGAALLALTLRRLKNPAPCPYGQRFTLELPRPFLIRTRFPRNVDARRHVRELSAEMSRWAG